MRKQHQGNESKQGVMNSLMKGRSQAPEYAGGVWKYEQGITAHTRVVYGVVSLNIAIIHNTINIIMSYLFTSVPMRLRVSSYRRN